MGEARRRKLKIGPFEFTITEKRPEFQTTRLYKGCNCLNCGILIDAATSVDHKELPKEGSIAICMICSHIMAYDEKVQFRELSDEEILEIAGNKDIIFLINGLGGAKAAWEKIHGEGSWGATSRKRLEEAMAKAESQESKIEGE